MNGKDLKVKLKHFNFSGNLNVEITNLKHDSRKIKAGDIFIALKSENGDGHRYIMDAIKRGARGIVVQENVDVPTDILKIKVPDTYSAYGEIANAIFDVPSKKISVVGTTGTMGKTTITYLLYRLFNFANVPSGFIGTIGIGYGDNFNMIDLSPPTTPFPFELNQYLNKMVLSNLKYAFIEVSSHGIKDKSIYGIDFYKKILGTMGIDHLDFHKTKEDYVNTKVSFFKESVGPILNFDSQFIERFIDVSIDPVFYGSMPSLDFSYEYLGRVGHNLVFNMYKKGELLGAVSLSLIGKFNISNFMAVSAFAIDEGLPFKTLAEFAKNASIPGRMELYEWQGRKIVVDYAHNPDEVEEVLSVLSEEKQGNLITVFGVVGTSNPEKRIQMGEVVSKFTDFAVVTSDNPRGVDEVSIIDDVLKGIMVDHMIFIDRREAIRYAMLYSKPMDTIAILGRGVEKRVELKNGKILEFRDMDIVKEVMNED